MSEIAPGLSTRLGKIGSTVVLRLELSSAGVTTTIYLMEDQMHALRDAVQFGIDAALAKRLGTKQANRGRRGNVWAGREK